MAGDSDLLQKAIDRLMRAEPAWKKFERKPEVGDKPGAVSTGSAAGSAGGSGGPSLIESDASKREFYAARTLTTSDGIFTIEQPVIKKLYLVGGGSIQFGEPPPA